MPKNLDELKEKKNKMLKSMADAFKANDEAAQEAAAKEFCDYVAENVLGEMRGIASVVESGVLAGRGVRALTSKETHFYNSMIDAMRPGAPKAAITNIDKAWPETIIDTVMDDIEAEHPLLEAIDFQNTGVVAKTLMNSQGVQLATWGKITTATTEALSGSIDMYEADHCKLTAFMVIPNDVLEAGPQWVDRYVRAILTDAIALAEETAVVNGTGKDQPIGMMRSTTTTDTDGTQKAKTAIAITDLSMKTIGKLKKAVSKHSVTGKYRPVTGLIMVVNPGDLYEKVEPARYLLTPNGYLDITRGEINFIPSVVVDEGTAAFGIGKKYKMYIGTAKDGVIEYDDSVKFDEDARMYRAKFRGNGRATDENDFLKLSFTSLTEAAVPTRTVS